MSRKAIVGKPIPDLEARATGGKTIRLGDLRGRNVVLYFYPKDETPGCTAEGQDFRDNHEKFRKLDTVIIGVSRDSLALHEKFKVRHKFPFDLVSDEDERLCRAFDVIREKKLYGRPHMGVERSTFLIDKDGVLRKEFRAVKVSGHVEEVLAELRRLTES
jgi:peroxiredoxin Q/BCP